MIAASTAFKAAHGVFLVLFIVTIVVWAAFEIRQSLHTRTGATHADRGSQLVIRPAVALGLLGGVGFARWVPAAQIRPIWLAGVLGLAFLWCGAGLRIWCFRTLGTYFTFTVQTSADQPVITAGPYRWLRHPSYTGLLCVVLGVGFFFDNWLSVLAIAVAALAGISYRIHVEEAALLEEMGERYRTFASTRKRLIPYVW